MVLERTVLIVVPATAWIQGGNWVTAERIGLGVRRHGWRAEVLPADRLAARVAEGGVHILHAIHARRSGVETARVAATAQLPYVVTFAGTDLAVDLGHSGTRDSIRQVVEGCAALTVFHACGAHAVRQALPEAAERLVVVPPGMDTLPDGRDRAHFGLQADDFVFMLPAGVRAVKRPTYALAPLGRLARHNPRLRLLIAGAALESAEEQRLRRALSGRPWAIWLGSVPRAQMGALYRSADVVLNTSTHEGLSNAVMEAMVIGRPLLLSDNPGNREAAAHSALYFGNPGEFRAQCERLIADPDLRLRLGVEARERALREFSPEREAAVYAALYTRVSRQETATPACGNRQ